LNARWVSKRRLILERPKKMGQVELTRTRFVSYIREDCHRPVQLAPTLHAETGSNDLKNILEVELPQRLDVDGPLTE
jgi:hypothetical protein